MGRNTHWVALLVVSLTLPGCVAAPLALGAAGGVATFRYLENQEVREYERPLGAVFDATLAALRQLDYPAASLTLPEHQEAGMQSGDVSISMAQFPEGLTRVAVRVGTFQTGDHRRRAELLHEAIARNLNAPKPLPAAEPSEDLARR